MKKKPNIALIITTLIFFASALVSMTYAFIRHDNQIVMLAHIGASIVAQLIALTLLKRGK